MSIAARPDVPALVQRAAALRQEQRMEEALETIREAVRRDASSPQAAFGLAQISFEAWRPAAELFAAARGLLPANADLVRNHALALAAEGRRGEAEQVLESAVDAQPLWLDGHRALASLRITSGEPEGFDRSFVAAVAKQPQEVSLRMAWFQWHAIRKDWEAAAKVLGDARAVLGTSRVLEMAALFLDCEIGPIADAEARFAPFEAIRDPGLDLCQTRYWLREGETARAERVAARQLSGASARLFWPYAGLAWRLLDDPRRHWLEGSPILATVRDLSFAPGELATLADVLRQLHRLRAPYPEQSVRGGTQTDRQLFFHPDPAIQSVRAKIREAVLAYAVQLPARESGHPLLDFRRDEVLFEGSWSVRLAAAGFHAAHTHTLGWISSALYVALPAADELGPAPAGWLGLGTPPPELRLPLQPYRRIEPKPGRLALFPSTMWHDTAPFAAGERLTIAFDVRLPRD